MGILKKSITDILLKFFACDSPLRKWIHDPGVILQGAGVRAGQTVLEVGCGRGFFTITLGERLGRLLPEMHRVLRPGGGLAVWTAVPWWSPQSVVQSGLFVYIDKKNKSHNFRKI
ncbi:hypothetical protein DRN98_07895 [Methanosarcinales archaeon]|nr:MAG: hypothetical protein DRN98_07895 [Methanosarcinales archaeon]